MTFSPYQLRMFTWLAIAAAAGVVLWLVGPALMPVVLAATFAYLLWPAALWMQHRGLSRPLAVTIAVFGGMLLVAALVLLLVPIVTTLLPKLQAQWPAMLDRFNNTFAPWLAEWGVHVDTASLREDVRKGLDGNVEAWIERLFSSLLIGGSWIVTILSGLVLVPTLAWYFLVDADEIGARIPSLVPLRLREGLFGFIGDCDLALRRYLGAQLVVMGAMAVFYAAGLSVVGLTLALPIGIFTGLAVFIPYLGFGTGLVLALLTALITYPTWHGTLAVGVVYAIGQVVESFFLTPRFVGGRIGLSPLGVIVMLLLFGEAFGFVGVLLSLPASAVGMVIIQRSLRRYHESDFYRA
jgi:predicted PurR-regulated permease PerM